MITLKYNKYGVYLVYPGMEKHMADLTTHLTVPCTRRLANPIFGLWVYKQLNRIGYTVQYNAR
jgi:hypothetical protein